MRCLKNARDTSANPLSSRTGGNLEPAPRDGEAQCSFAFWFRRFSSGHGLGCRFLTQVLVRRELVTEARRLKMYKASRDTFIVSGKFLRLGYRSEMANQAISWLRAQPPSRSVLPHACPSHLLCAACRGSAEGRVDVGRMLDGLEPIRWKVCLGLTGGRGQTFSTWPPLDS